MMADLPILHFRNPWPNDFLEEYNLHYFKFVPQQQAIFECVYEIKF